MKKLIALILMLTCLLSMVGCQLNQPDFENFQEYEADFNIIKNFLVDFNFNRNDATPLIVDLNSQFLTIAGDEVSDSTIEDSVKAIYKKHLQDFNGVSVREEDGVALLEGVRLGGVEEGRYLLCAQPLKLKGADGAPCRALLIEM